MDQDYSSAVPGHARFDSTRWTVVLDAARSRGQGGSEALANLCARRWTPLYTFGRRRGHGLEELKQVQVSAGKGEAFRTVKYFLGDDGDRAAMSYEEAAGALDVRLRAIKVLIHRLGRRHTHLVREEMERTVLDPAKADAELHALCEALITAEGCVRL